MRLDCRVICMQAFIFQTQKALNWPIHHWNKFTEWNLCFDTFLIVYSAFAFSIYFPSVKFKPKILSARGTVTLKKSVWLSRCLSCKKWCCSGGRIFLQTPTCSSIAKWFLPKSVFNSGNSNCFSKEEKEQQRKTRRCDLQWHRKLWLWSKAKADIRKPSWYVVQLYNIYRAVL